MDRDADATCQPGDDVQKSVGSLSLILEFSADAIGVSDLLIGIVDGRWARRRWAWRLQVANERLPLARVEELGHGIRDRLGITHPLLCLPERARRARSAQWNNMYARTAVMPTETHAEQ